jgi:hypothetical protein
VRIERASAGVRAVALTGIVAALGLWVLGTILTAGAGDAAGQEPSKGAPRGRVLLAYGPGGVLTTDGTLWQYRPDLDRWMTIDEASREEGHSTHVLPLPVAAEDIQEMESFGFFVTRAGQAWFYEIESDKWKPIEPPQR